MGEEQGDIAWWGETGSGTQTWVQVLVLPPMSSGTWSKPWNLLSFSVFSLFHPGTLTLCHHLPHRGVLRIIRSNEKAPSTLQMLKERNNHVESRVFYAGLLRA